MPDTEETTLDRVASEADGRQPPLLRLDRGDAAWLAGGLLFLILMFSHVLFTASAACVGKDDGDGRTQFYPWRVYGFLRLAQGEFPLWNPYTFAGMPFVANLQSAMFYPTNWLCLAMPHYRAVNVGVVLNLFLSLAFAYGWARMTGRGRLGAMVVGATYAMAAPQFLRVYEGHWVHLCAMPWIPWLMACVEALVRRGGTRPALLGAAGLALQAFAGHPQYVFYGAIAACLYFAARLAGEWRSIGGLPAVGGRAVGFALIFVLGMVLASVQMLPSLELLSVSSRRGQLSYEWIAQYSLAPEGLATMLAPWLYGNGPDVPYWGRWNAWEMGVYLGCVGLALAVFGAVAAGRKWRWTALGLFAALLLLALGGYTPLLRVLAAVPGFGLFRGLSRFTAPMSLFFGLLAGAGADALLDRGTRRWLPAFAAVALLAATMWAASIATARPTDRTAPAFWTAFMRKSLALGERPASYHDAAVERSAWFAREAYRVAWGSLARSTMLISVVAVAAGLWRWRGLAPRRASAAVALAMACDFWCYGRPYLVTFDGLDFAWSQESVQYLRQVREPFRVATGALYSAGPLDALVYGVPCVEGVEPNVPLRFRDLFWRALDQPTTTQKTSYHVSGRSQSMHLLRLLGLRFLLSPPSEAVIDIPGAHTVHQDKRVRIDELPGWLPRARLAFRSRVVPDPQQALEALTTSVYERETILDAPLPYREPWAGPIGPSPPPEFVVDQPERVVLRCQAVCPSFLVLGDIHYPGWRARLDGRPMDILRADYLLRAVAVPAGRHEVEFTYEPESFRVGAWASGVGWAALAAALAVHAFLRRRMRHGNDK